MLVISHFCHFRSVLYEIRNLNAVCVAFFITLINKALELHFCVFVMLYFEALAITTAELKQGFSGGSNGN